MGPRILIELSIAILLLTTIVARAETPYGQPTNTPKPQPQPAPAPVGTPNPFSSTTSTATPTPTTPTSQPTGDSRAPSSVDKSNTYQGGGGGAFGFQGGNPNKEPVIDGKSIPKTIDFTAGNPEQSAKPEPQATAAPAPKPRRKGGGKGKGSPKRADTSIEFDQEDDGFVN